jgi:hypothetical protein
MYIVLIKDCVLVINKPCVPEARYMRLISWIPRCGSEHYKLPEVTPIILLICEESCEEGGEVCC